MFLALIAPPGTHRLVKGILPRRAAKEFDVARAEECGWGIAKSHFADGHQSKFLHRLSAALRLRVEGFDAFQIVAEKIQPDGVDPPRREEIENTAANGEFTRLHDGTRALKAIEAQAAHKFGHINALTRRNRLKGCANKCPRR